MNKSCLLLPENYVYCLQIESDTIIILTTWIVWNAIFKRDMSLKHWYDVQELLIWSYVKSLQS